AGDLRSDVFSLGVVMWEALTHARLFEGLTDDAIKAAVLDDEIAAPSTKNANIPSELDAICLRPLARDPAARYPTVAAMAVEVEGVLRDVSNGRTNDAIAALVTAPPKEMFRKRGGTKPPKVADKASTGTIMGFPQPKAPAAVPVEHEGKSTAPGVG